jgi:hypothetical protein
MGAVALDSVELSAGPASLPTDEGHADVNAFWFSTDSSGQIVDWDIDLSLWDPSGIINVDTDNRPWGPVDSAAVSGGFANVVDNPGKWRKLGRHGMRPNPIFRDQSRTYGHEVGASVCVNLPHLNLDRCADPYASENYDAKGTYQYTDLWINYGIQRIYPDGSSAYAWRWMSCQVGLDAIEVQPIRVTLAAMPNPNTPECFSDGFREDCDPFGNCEVSWWGYTGPTEVTGEWMEPLNTTKAVVNQTSESYDPWSDTFSRTVTHCNERGGDLMTRGGFAIGNREFPFEGIATQGCSFYGLRSCNDQQTER